MSHLVIAPVLVPLLAGLLLLLLRSGTLERRRLLSVAMVAVQILLALWLVQITAGGEILVYALGNWPAPFGIVLVADRLASWMLLTTGLLAFFALLYAVRGVDRIGRHFHILFQWQLLGLNGAFLTGDLFNLFVFFEILLLASYGLILHGGGRLRVRAGLHYVVLNLVGSTLFLFAVGALYGVLGTLNMADLALKAATVSPEQLPVVRAAGLVLFAVFALKAALVPLYLWLPAAYANTSAPVAALFAIMTKVGAYAIVRVYTLVFGAEAGAVADLIEPWLLPLALATLTLGTLGALASRALSQQTAYLVVASVGSLLTAVGLGSEAGLAAALYYLPHTTFAIGAMYLLADTIASRRGALGDRFEPAPPIAQHAVVGALFFTLAVVVSGLPPLSGFVGKFLTLRAAVDHPLWAGVFAAVLGAGLLTVIALARSGSLLFFRALPREEGDAAPVAAVTGYQGLIPGAALLGLCIAMTLWAGKIHQHSTAIATQLLTPTDYIHAVLGGRR
ncbi:MAG: monovalent cation/H+ antiporter subunit D [Thiotrichales bacterium]